MENHCDLLYLPYIVVLIRAEAALIDACVTDWLHFTVDFDSLPGPTKLMDRGLVKLPSHIQISHSLQFKFKLLL